MKTELQLGEEGTRFVAERWRAQASLIERRTSSGLALRSVIFCSAGGRHLKHDKRDAAKTESKATRPIGPGCRAVQKVCSQNSLGPSSCSGRSNRSGRSLSVAHVPLVRSQQARPAFARSIAALGSPAGWAVWA